MTDLTPSTYPLDPRDPEGAQVEIVSEGRYFSARFLLGGQAMMTKLYDTARAALTAAREAAGFGDVAEQPCDYWKCSHVTHCQGHDCHECFWPRAAHTERRDD